MEQTINAAFEILGAHKTIDGLLESEGEFVSRLLDYLNEHEKGNNTKELSKVVNVSYHKIRRIINYLANWQVIKWELVNPRSRSVNYKLTDYGRKAWKTFEDYKNHRVIQ